MRKIRAVFDPKNLCNRGKAIPSRRCWEVKGHEPPALEFGVRRAHA
jgi:hypothetical protein